MRSIFTSLLLLALLASSTLAFPGLLVVLYSYPTDNGGAIWDGIISAKTNNPSLPMIAIVNPDSGPGSSLDNTYASAVQSLVDAGIRVIGYVSTNYANVPTATVQSNMDKYVQWYNGIEGFFLDEMKNVIGSETYYANLTAYAVSLGKGFTMGNPGTASSPSYFATVNNSVIYERFPLPKPEVLDLGYDIEKCSMIAYQVSAQALNQTYINQITQHVSWIWITDDNGPNPYDTNPSYFSALISLLRSVPTPQSIAPTDASSNLAISLTVILISVFVIMFI